MQQNPKIKTSSIIFFVLAIMAALMIMASCHNPKRGKIKVQVYTTKMNEDNTSDNDGNDIGLLYWYIIMSDNGGYYYTTSTTPLSNVSSQTWTPSSTLPSQLVGQTPVEEMEADTESVPEEIAEQAETETEAEAEADAEGDSSNGESDGSAGDDGASSVGDDGGGSAGDSGGGDGGGGGGE